MGRLGAGSRYAVLTVGMQQPFCMGQSKKGWEACKMIFIGRITCLKPFKQHWVLQSVQQHMLRCVATSISCFSCVCIADSSLACEQECLVKGQMRAAERIRVLEEEVLSMNQCCVQ